MKLFGPLPRAPLPPPAGATHNKGRPPPAPPPPPPLRIRLPFGGGAGDHKGPHPASAPPPPLRKGAASLPGPGTLCSLGQRIVPYYRCRSIRTSARVGSVDLPGL